jgi:hypothetical protein
LYSPTKKQTDCSTVRMVSTERIVRMGLKNSEMASTAELGSDQFAADPRGRTMDRRTLLELDGVFAQSVAVEQVCYPILTQIARCLSIVGKVCAFLNWPE